MGHDYALVHLKYTIPPAIVLTYAYYPLCTRLCLYKITFLILIAVLSATPWDAYLIKNQIWTYPPNTILGPTLFGIPIEEVFFFVIQTYDTSLLYLSLSKPTFHSIYLKGEKLLRDSKRTEWWRWIGIAVILVMLCLGFELVTIGGKPLYLGLIIVWAGPFILLLWTLAYQFILGLPKTNTLIPIIVPTLYLWSVDTFALRRGTWAIQPGTKLEWYLWDGLDFEEAFFFLITNVLIVFGLVAFDNAKAVLDAFPALFLTAPTLPSPILLIRALLVPTKLYDDFRIEGLKQALERLKAKSRSFYLASGVFQGRLRIDLILLYSFCRVADDLVDDAETFSEARDWVQKLRGYIEKGFSKSNKRETTDLDKYVISNFPSPVHTALRLLPIAYLPSGPLYDLLQGFEMDLEFSSKEKRFPIEDEPSLHLYGARVAGTVAECILELVYHHIDPSVSSAKRKEIVQAGARMGIALQLVNIARDISVDASNGRVYIPSTWLKETGMTANAIIRDPSSSEAEILRQRVLDEAMNLYKRARDAIDELPPEARGPMRVAVESYVEIGRVLRQPGYKVKAGRATVPIFRRLMVARKALLQT